MDKELLEIILSIEENNDLVESLNDGIFDNEQLKRFVELTKYKKTKHSLYNSINANQRKCKRWLLDSLSILANVIKSPDSILVLGGWYGGIAAMLKRKYGCLVRCIDIDPEYKSFSKKIYKDYIQFRQLDFVKYPIEKKYHDLIVSTSCEHFKKDDLLDFIDRTPEGITFCLQSNDYYGIDGHITCFESIESFIEYLPFKSYWADILPLENYNRFMVIATK